ncbi:chaperone modulator CbpM [Mucilaginibacter sp.]
MATDSLIAANDFCVYYNVEYTFINSLQEAGLVQITTVNETTYIPETELQKLERMIHLHHDLEINIAGIEAITHLLGRMEEMQENMRILKNQLRIYEQD